MDEIVEMLLALMADIHELIDVFSLVHDLAYLVRTDPVALVAKRTFLKLAYRGT